MLSTPSVTCNKSATKRKSPNFDDDASDVTSPAKKPFTEDETQVEAVVSFFYIIQKILE